MLQSLIVIRRVGQLLLLSLMFGQPSAAATNENQVVPFEMDKYSRPIVELTLNDGVTAKGVIDTAATLPMINSVTARAAGVAGIDGEPVRLVTVLGLGGPEDFPLVELTLLSAGNVDLSMQPTALGNKVTIDGVNNVFPVSVLQGDVIDFDFERGNVSAYDASPLGRSRDILSKSPLEVRDGLFFTKVSINGVEGLALIDTGSSITYVNSRFAEISKTRTNKKKTEQLQGITGNKYDVRIARIRRMAVGDMKLVGLDFLVSDPVLFEYLGIAEEPVMVLGVDFLHSFRVQIDRKRERLVLRNRRGSDKQNCYVCVGVALQPTLID